MDKSSMECSFLLQSLSIPQFSSGPSLDVAGALHAGVLCWNWRRHHWQDTLWWLTVTVQTSRTRRPRNAGSTGNTTRSPLSVTAIFTVSWSTGITWKMRNRTGNVKNGFSKTQNHRMSAAFGIFLLNFGSICLLSIDIMKRVQQQMIWVPQVSDLIMKSVWDQDCGGFSLMFETNFTNCKLCLVVEQVLKSFTACCI